MSRLWISWTDGFSLDHITYRQPPDHTYQQQPMSSDVEEILGTPFFYVAKGCQSYVFASKQFPYVLKFFKEKHLQPKRWHEWLYPSSFLHPIQKKKQHQRHQIMTACELASSLEDLYGITYTHLNVGDPIPRLDLHLTFFDPIGRFYCLDPTEYAFYIQKTGLPFKKTIVKLLNQGEVRRVELIMDKVLTLLAQRAKLGVRDRDPALMQNLALDGDSPFFIDVGQIEKDPLIQQKETYLCDLEEKITPCLELFIKKSPTVYKSLIKTLEKLKNQATEQI